MKNILLSPPSDRWHRLVHQQDDPVLYRSFNRGIQFLKLRPEPLSGGVRRVGAYLNDTRVGELAGNDARYFHTEVNRLNDNGLELFLECKVATSNQSGRTILYRHINRDNLMAWVREQIKNKPREEANEVQRENSDDEPQNLLKSE